MVMVGVALLAAMAVLPAAATAAATAAKQTPNVLMIVVDDLRPMLPSWGYEHVQAPNIAKFAASALVFNHTYVQQAVCGPSRNSFMTGRRPDHTRVWNFKTSFRAAGVDANARSPTQRLRVRRIVAAQC